MKSREFLTTPETARLLNCTIKYAYDLVYAGRLNAVKVAGRWRIPRKEVVARLKRRGGNARLDN
jgi:excisionase family DNA binding protein